MPKRTCVSMILAGGQGTRLSPLTTKTPKPAIPFGGMCRLIDFTLSNCYNSGINTAGVLTSKSSFAINKQIGSIGGIPPCNIYALPPSRCKTGEDSYTGTANAIYQNISFIEQFNPEYVLILSGDHVYKMDYNLLLEYHKAKNADVTISVFEVPWAEASRFGVMKTLSDGTISEFTEKPASPKSNLASMGVYVFSWPKLKYYLELDELSPNSCHDFGKNIIPSMLTQGERLFAYLFTGYWKDVGTLEEFHSAHMDLLVNPPAFVIQEELWPVYSTLPSTPHIIATMAAPNKSLVCNECSILGQIEHSVFFPGTHIAKNAIVKNSVVMPGARIDSGAYVEQAIIGPWAVVEKGCIIRGGVNSSMPVAIVSEKAMVSPGLAFLR